MTYRVRNIGIAVALAVIAALLTSFYVTNYKRHVQRGEDHVTVLVAKHDIPVGTAGSDAVGMMSTTEVPRRSVVPGSISSPDEIKSLVASQGSLHLMTLVAKNHRQGHGGIAVVIGDNNAQRQAHARTVTRRNNSQELLHARQFTSRSAQVVINVECRAEPDALVARLLQEKCWLR